MACSLGPGNTFPGGMFILTVPRPGHNSETARTPQPSKNNNTRRRAAPFNSTIPPTNIVSTTHTHGVWLLEIVASFSFLDTKLFPRWKIILTIHAIRTGVTGYGLTVHRRGGAASDGHPHIYPHGLSNADVCACSNNPGAGRRAAAFSRCHRPSRNLHNPSDSSARTACSLSSNSKFYPRPTALTIPGRPVHMP
jgi:hypothetical protein